MGRDVSDREARRRGRIAESHPSLHPTLRKWIEAVNERLISTTTTTSTTSSTTSTTTTA